MWYIHHKKFEKVNEFLIHPLKNHIKRPFWSVHYWNTLNFWYKNWWWIVLCSWLSAAMQNNLKIGIFSKKIPSFYNNCCDVITTTILFKRNVILCHCGSEQIGGWSMHLAIWVASNGKVTLQSAHSESAQIPRSRASVRLIQTIVPRKLFF